VAEAARRTRATNLRALAAAALLPLLAAGFAGCPPASRSPDALSPEARSVFLDRGGDVPAAVEATPAVTSAGFLWLGLEHEWLRSIAGFRVPHRISRLVSVVEAEQHQGSAAAWRAEARFRLGQGTGVDGNYMKPVGHYGALHSPGGLLVERGSLPLAWSDDGDDGPYPQAHSDLSRDLVVELAHAVEEHAVVLRGLELDVRCDEAKQPPGRPCNSDGMWPYRIVLGVGACAREGSSRLRCPLAILLDRAWTPNQGGLPPFATKPFNDRLDFSLTIYYTVVGGDATALRVTRAAHRASGRARDDQPLRRTSTVAGAPGAAFARAAAAVTRLGFTFVKSESGDKFNHLGRYIGALRFHAWLTAYDPVSGAAAVDHTTQVWVPDTVEDTAVDYELDVALLQLGADGAAAVSGREARGSICQSSKGAPFFSAWSHCGEAETGPERSEDVAKITAPY
jgi:hypothetical protein